MAVKPPDWLAGIILQNNDFSLQAAAWNHARFWGLFAPKPLLAYVPLV
jgi:hypothetical protein